jgi:hypothetical protein
VAFDPRTVISATRSPKLKSAHAIAELIDFTDHVIAQHERRLAVQRLRVEVTPDHDIGVHDARGKYADPHLAPARYRLRSIDHLQPIGTTEAPDLNNSVARLPHRRFPCNS